MNPDVGREFFRMQNWYPYVSAHTFPTVFVPLRCDAVELLAEGAEGEFDPSRDRCPTSKQVIRDLTDPMSTFPSNRFLTVDTCAPTDTDRFAVKGGSVHSPQSAWHFMLLSKKVAQAAAAGDVNFLCIRPFRTLNRPREFRAFIWNGNLSAMSQYNLDRHFARLESVKEEYWKLTARFVEQICWALPVKTLVMDIYITRDNKVLIIDLNPWGCDTDPLLLRSWDRNWGDPAGVVLLEPPQQPSPEKGTSLSDPQKKGTV